MVLKKTRFGGFFFAPEKVSAGYAPVERAGATMPSE